ncbi:2-oxoglutarate and Fe(II)-dependent oxygenase superfamily protein isoform 1 [Theobroma cacao]|uniref:2-oxoglutarate and Fe(II)-dependent oxygenase superfamily protein isoform 1 n=1 Tax=Theobroma cacao TaxID=3641 RepID=A0A061GUV2_THECC|nr:2-oxoglutarate and Fe(II)-dependent oxygenase superfamily protein isoform 1 [Theobroma cacao]
MRGKRVELESLWEEVREVSLGNSVDHLHSPPTPLQFLRDFVSQNKPCLISNSISHWPALSLWPTPSYLSTSLSSSLVSLHLTPDGQADALAPHPLHPSLCFVSAHVQPTPFPHALDLIRQPPNHLVAYLQQQNDCFRTEYSELESDCDDHIPWASEALGCLPEAVNLWIGNHLSETSFHKDHYENLYAVVSGEKHFLLLPPTDVHRMYIRDYPAARYCYSEESGEFRLELEEPERRVPWCSVDPYPATGSEERSKFPLYFNGPKPFEVTVKAGEILYLPSMWFHHVKQSPGDGGCTIAVNYWYDMQFDIKYAYFNFLQSLPYQSTDDQTIPESECEDLGYHPPPNHLSRNLRYLKDHEDCCGLPYVNMIKVLTNSQRAVLSAT